MIVRSRRPAGSRASLAKRIGLVALAVLALIAGVAFVASRLEAAGSPPRSCPPPVESSVSSSEPPTPHVPVVYNVLGMGFVRIPAGRFVMGVGAGFVGDGDYEKPARTVTISKPFFLGRFEVTRAEWGTLMGDPPGRGRGSYRTPVSGVSWEDATEFIKRLNEREGTEKYRLPTEAEWEYAARAGSETAYWFGDDPKELGRYGWCGEGFTDGSPHESGLKPANVWGLHDVHGNVSEWVSDWFDEKYYGVAQNADPRGPREGSTKTRRGGAWASDQAACQSAWRENDLPTLRSPLVGFRVAYDD